MRCLVVDDDPKLREYVQAGLSESGFEVETAADGDSALSVLAQAQRSFDVILLDVMLPAQSGWELLEQIRETGRETPVIFVTARDTVEERVKGLRLGAEDYVIKPFAFSELLARIEVVVRRRKSLPPVEVQDVKLDLVSRAAYRSGRKIDLSPREFDLLLALTRAEGRTLSRADLLRDVWGFEREPETNLVDVHVGRLRRKLDRHGPSLIATVRGEGYRIHESV